MFLARKTLAKYGARIPTGRSTGATQAQAGKQMTSVDALAKAVRAVAKVDAKKR
jgi:hypothetical protein